MMEVTQVAHKSAGQNQLIEDLASKYSSKELFKKELFYGTLGFMCMLLGTYFLVGTIAAIFVGADIFWISLAAGALVILIVMTVLLMRKEFRFFRAGKLQNIIRAEYLAAEVEKEKQMLAEMFQRIRSRDRQET